MKAAKVKTMGKGPVKESGKLKFDDEIDIDVTMGTKKSKKFKLKRMKDKKNRSVKGIGMKVRKLYYNIITLHCIFIELNMTVNYSLLSVH